MLSALILGGALSLAQGVKPPDYTQRSLCELWAGAQCQAAKCGANAEEACKLESKKCSALPKRAVSKERAERVVNCAKAMLKKQCKEPDPAECAGMPQP